ncbi:hypothetical protein FA95DRAFT_1557624 [Auriscalpium vulgare]|uniref:Uncharacterized protein n=1 Tax=Auriscalpium vulgare TaxID=40419 RepID=A0ACB8RXM6_9AGAM|nr:hypothetical protein FA95DRAFT_1557624 [Auriscalpium vulgare]
MALRYSPSMDEDPSPTDIPSIIEDLAYADGSLPRAVIPLGDPEELLPERPPYSLGVQHHAYYSNDSAITPVTQFERSPTLYSQASDSIHSTSDYSLPIEYFPFTGPLDAAPSASPTLQNTESDSSLLGNIDPNLRKKWLDDFLSCMTPQIVASVCEAPAPTPSLYSQPEPEARDANRLSERGQKAAAALKNERPRIKQASRRGRGGSVGGTRKYDRFCPECTCVFDRASNIKEHIATHKDIPLHLCPDCGQSISRDRDMKRHRLKKHGGVVEVRRPDCAANLQQSKPNGVEEGNAALRQRRPFPNYEFTTNPRTYDYPLCQSQPRTYGKNHKNYRESSGSGQPAPATSLNI